MTIEPDIVIVSAGSLMLGEPAFPADSKLHRWDRREVFVPQFGIARFAVTVGEMLNFADRTRYPIADELRGDPCFKDPRAPAAFVSWIDAARYVQWLARETGKPYRLVRDAEYERASRGGKTGARYPWGDEPPDARADWNNPKGSPKPVGSFAPNGFGLHDMAGSMWSWCEECFDQVVTNDHAKMCYDDTLLRDVRQNPICRGGSYKTGDPVALQCAHRHEDPTDGRFDCIGFRVAMSI